jgi:hypothetical protein
MNASKSLPHRISNRLSLQPYFDDVGRHPWQRMLCQPPYTTGIDKGADGLHLRRRPKVGAIGVGWIQATQLRRPSAYENPRCRPRYADGHPRRISVVGVCGGHVALQVKGIPALSRCHISAECGRRRIVAIGVRGGYAEGGRRCISAIGV